jgi:cytoskeletal protein CcmA (bactofilin family)
MSSVNPNPGERPAQAAERRPFPPPAGSAPQAAASPEGLPKPSVLGKTLVFKGELSADEDLILQGRVEGSIHHTQSLTVGIDGVVIGDTHARSIVVEGTVEGDLYASVSVLVMASAKVRGNIAAPRVGITEGATFNGSVDMSSTPAVARVDTTHRGSGSTPSLSETSVEKILNRP